MASSAAATPKLDDSKQSSFNLLEGWFNNKKEKKRKEKQQAEEESTNNDDDDDLLNQTLFFNKNSENQEQSDEEEDALEQVHQAKPKKQEGWSGFVGMIQDLILKTKEDKDDDDDDDDHDVAALVQKARQFQQQQQQQDDSTTSSEGFSRQDLEKLQTEVQMVATQVANSFQQDMNLKLCNPVSFMYYLEHEESIKTASWKRRKHRFMQELQDPVSEVKALHDALYLAEAAYLDSVQDITTALQNYKGGPKYELIYCNTNAQPREPAHYIALKKTAVDGTKKKKQFLPWQNKNNNTQSNNNNKNILEILFVVRGTKDLSDMLSDCLLESREYYDGYAHDGVCQAGLFLVNKHAEFFQHLLEESGRASMQISFVGHSLGAGAASIACMEFNQSTKNISATCIGFGCPALVSKEISEQYKDQITTVVCDADCISRMSKATVLNLMLNIMSHDWTAKACKDVDELVSVVQQKVPALPTDFVKQATGWVAEHLNTKLKPDIERVVRERQTVELFPPGQCIHMFRDGLGVSIRYVPCTFFDEFDVCFTMVNDHLVATGYNRLFYEFMRETTNNSRFFFRNDVNVLRKEVERAAHEKETGKKKE